MNLHHEFNKILDGYGYPVLVVRQNKKIRCSCFDEKTQEADRKCPVCFGLGWNPIVEKWMSRGEDVTIPESLARAPQQGTIGTMAVPSRQWFFQAELQAQPKDLVVDVDWSPTGKPIYSGRGIFEVSHVDTTLKFEKGEDIYRVVYCKDTPVNKDIRGIRIVEVNGIINYELALEDK